MVFLNQFQQTSVMGSAISISKSADGKNKEEGTKLVKDSDTNAPYEGHIFVDYLKAGKAAGIFLVFFFFLVSAQFCASFSDFWVSEWLVLPLKMDYSINSPIIPQPQ